MTPDQALGLMEKVRDRWPTQTIPVASIKAYAEDILPFEYADAEKAINLVMQRSDYWPSVKEIVTTYAEVRLDAPDVTEGFEQANGPVAEMHPLVKEARRRVGDPHYWRNTDRRDLWLMFRDAYRDVMKAAIRKVIEAGPTMASLPESDKIVPREIEPPDSD